MAVATGQTVHQWLEKLATTDTSQEADWEKMTNLLRRFGFTKAVCTCGIVYLEGHGTPEAPPTDIHSIARMFCKKESE